MHVRSPSINFIQKATIDDGSVPNETHLTVQTNRPGDMSLRMDFIWDEKSKGSGGSRKRMEEIGIIGAPSAVIPRVLTGL